jgi:hypothetical protein
MPRTLQGGWFRQRVLIVVRTYPTPATNGVEVSCTAGITADGEWVRLFPIPYRFLDPDSQFSKYHWIDVSTKKAARDARPESFTIDRDSIVIGSFVGTRSGWRDRKAIVYPHRAHCHCCLTRAYEANGEPTLGLIRPKQIVSLEIEPTSDEWSADELRKLRQDLPSMFGEQRRPKQELEKIPFNFRYVFTCDEPDCHGHKLMCADWEMAQLYRTCRREYGAEGWEAKFRQRYESEMIQKFDTHFYVGTVHRYGTWIIVGVFYPPCGQEPAMQQSLFELDS